MVQGRRFCKLWSRATWIVILGASCWSGEAGAGIRAVRSGLSAKTRECKHAPTYLEYRGAAEPVDTLDFADFADRKIARSANLGEKEEDDSGRRSSDYGDEEETNEREEDEGEEDEEDEEEDEESEDEADTDEDEPSRLKPELIGYSDMVHEIFEAGSVEYVTNQLGQMVYSYTVRPVGAIRPHKLKEMADKWTRVLEKDDNLGRRYASAELLPLVSSYHHARGETSASTKLQLAPEDHEIIERIFSRYPGGASRILGGTAYCNSEIVTCNIVNGALRVTGFDVVTIVATDSAMNPTRLPLEAAEFTELKKVLLAPHALLRSTGAISPEQACKFLESIPDLEILVLVSPLPPSCNLPNLLAISLDPADDVQRGTAETPLNRIMVPSELEFVCNSPKLKYFETQATGVPPCMGGNVELRRVDLRGGQLTGPLPPETARWTKLVDFVAFEQSAQWCYTPVDEAEGADKTALKNRGCKVNWHAKSGTAETQEEDPQPLWHCSQTGWVVPFDDLSNPWWSWREIERFWVDVNFLYGSIPRELPDRWPRLRTLDLYGNELSGAVPASLCRLTQLETLQLQDNHLSGQFPFEAFFTECPGVDTLSPVTTLSLAINEDLEGCASRQQMMKSKVNDFYVNYTNIRIDHDCSMHSRDEF
eukprot:m.168947 g.168947  ORF g.168947 m.168947 type:complete len:650 (+) comp14762_c0_seq1:85-2034(+)